MEDVYDWDAAATYYVAGNVSFRTIRSAECGMWNAECGMHFFHLDPLSSAAPREIENPSAHFGDNQRFDFFFRSICLPGRIGWHPCV